MLFDCRFTSPSDTKSFFCTAHISHGVFMLPTVLASNTPLSSLGWGLELVFLLRHCLLLLCSSKSQNKMRFVWKIKHILSRHYGGPLKPEEEADSHNTEIATNNTKYCKLLTADTTTWTLRMLNHLVITQIHCLILVYQQFRSLYWHPPGWFLCQLMVMQVPLKPLDNGCLPGWAQSEENG